MTAIFLLLALVARGAPEQLVRTYLEQRISPPAQDCLVITCLPQQYFPLVTFARVDTTCKETFHPRSDYKPIRLAIDTAGQIYHIYNFGSPEYSHLVRNYPVSLSPANAHEYGLFFLKTTYLYYEGDYYYLSELEELKKLNRSDTKDWWEFPEEFEKRAQEIDKTIDSLSQTVDSKPVAVVDSGRAFLLTYFIWYQSSGKLREIQLRVELHGQADVKSDKVIADKVGFYEEVRWGN